MKFLSGIFEEKYGERKKSIQGKTNKRMPILNSTKQLVVVSSYTKYKVSILNGCGDIVDEKCKEKKKYRGNK